MKYITIILTLISFKISAQEITIKDILTQHHIEGVSISSNTNSTGVISNNKGISKLESFKSIDTLIIQHLAYQNLSITKKDIQNNIIFTHQAILACLLLLRYFTPKNLADER